MKLYYFDIPGKGEAIRLICQYSNISLEDIRLDGESFMEMKKTLRFGQLPCLEVEGKDGKTCTITQSAAIMRYIAKMKGGDLYPAEDPLQAAIIDSIIDQENDLFAGLSVATYKERYGFQILVDDPSLNDRVTKSLLEETIPRHLSNLEKVIKSGTTEWIAGGASPSIADFILVPRLIWLSQKEGFSEILKVR
jgi:glutathione S-transferase